MSTGNNNQPSQGNTTAITASTTTASANTLLSNDDPEKLLNEWLGELKTIIGDLDTKAAATESPNKTGIQARNRRNRSSEFNRFSMANLEDTHETELDAILGELSLLEMTKSTTTTTTAAAKAPPRSAQRGGQEILSPPTPVVDNRPNVMPPNQTMHHQRSNSIVSTSATSTISSLSTDVPSTGGGYAESSSSGVSSSREPRTESPDNDSAFSDTVSLLSTDTSSTSSGLTNGQFHNKSQAGPGSHLCRGLNLQEFDNQKAAKIHLALQKLEQASVRRLFVKAFTADGASKSLLVDETMSSGHVTRLLADKNHVHMDSRWALVEQLPEIQMERLYEDHELLVDKLMMWDRDSKNRILFVERSEKAMLFLRPELFLPDNGVAVMPKDMDECNRNYLLEDFFNSPNSQMPMEGGLYLRADSKKGWKRHHFVLRGSGLYYYPKDKTRSPRDLVCLGLFNDCEVYKGFGWKKKYKAPSDYTFVLHAAHELANSKTTKPLKILCADDAETWERWILAIRVAKYGKVLWQSYKALKEELARDDFDELTTRRSSSINSFAGSNLDGVGMVLGSGNGRPLSRASSSSSSGCLSDENNGFDSEFTTGTIKRKPSMKPNLPLTSMTRQLKEVGENRQSPIGSPERGGTLTRARVAQPNHIRQRSIDSSGSGGSGCSTLKRRPPPAIQQQQQQSVEIKEDLAVVVTSPLKSMPSCMTDSLFSLPPPPEEDVLSPIPAALGSTMSLDLLPPPPSENELEESLLESSFSSELGGSSIAEEIYSSAAAQVRATALPVNGLPANVSNLMAGSHTITGPVATTTTKKATTPIYAQPKKELESCLKKESIYATKGELRTAAVASPVTLRKKVCFEDQVSVAVLAASPTKRLTTTSSTSSNSIYGSLPPKPPPRSEGTRLSTQPTAAASNNEFLKDLQRVMRKKWQVAQKCKLEPETNPHEVLGFRDFAEWQKQNNQLPFYRQSANVSNWVQEHYGPDSLYENLGGVGGGPLEPAPTPQSTQSEAVVVPASKKRPPPLPPKRSETTQLSNNQSPVHQSTNGQSL